MVIKYGSGGLAPFVSKLLQTEGSVFPLAFAVALPSGVVGALFKTLQQWHRIDDGWQQSLGMPEILTDSAPWSSFTFLVGFLIVFRTSEAYGRFWDGCTATHQLRAHWFSACAETLAFCKHSRVAQEHICDFQHTLVRLFSLLHAVALAEIEDCESDDPMEVMALGYPLIDIQSLSKASLLRLRESVTKVELVYQWLQQLLVENINTGVLDIPAPILARSFDQLTAGMLQFQEAMKISTIPFPFPYAQTAQWLLILHWVAVPFMACQWVSSTGWAFVFAFLQVFVLWALNLIAVEIENPFGMDANDIDAKSMQLEMNEFLIAMLYEAQQETPSLTERAKQACRDVRLERKMLQRKASVRDVWDGGADDSWTTDNINYERHANSFVSDGSCENPMNRGASSVAKNSNGRVDASGDPPSPVTPVTSATERQARLEDVAEDKQLVAGRTPSAERWRHGEKQKQKYLAPPQNFAQNWSGQDGSASHTSGFTDVSHASDPSASRNMARSVRTRRRGTSSVALKLTQASFTWSSDRSSEESQCPGSPPADRNAGVGSSSMTNQNSEMHPVRTIVSVLPSIEEGSINGIFEVQASYDI
mmetsp:Transcript_35457/g.81099  ORF Transcript_35457/g.81099 Transcript_35457/m.81099 type:complete len:591 (-) Transcript_35457:129-1901(-)